MRTRSTRFSVTAEFCRAGHHLSGSPGFTAGEHRDRGYVSTLGTADHPDQTVPHIASAEPYVRQRTVLRAAVLPATDAIALITAALAVGGGGWFAASHAAITLLILAAAGTYRSRICRRVHDQVPWLVLAAILPCAVASPTASGVGQAMGAALALPSAALLVSVHALACAALRAAHRRGLLLEPALIVGADLVGQRMGRALRAHPELGLRLVGFVDDQPASGDGPAVLGSVAELADVVSRYGIRRIIVCFPAVDDAGLVSVLRSCAALPVNVCLVPRLSELGFAVPRGHLDEVWGIPLIPLRRAGRWLAPAAKRAFDLAVGAVLLVLFAPVLVVLAGAVRLRHDGAVWFRQVRVTETGRTAAILKLRSVRADLVGTVDADIRWTVSQRQCTRLGRWLRATHCDELPQLINVLRGEMSLVGPRPERPYFATRFAAAIPHYEDRHRRRAGMTGWAQIHGLCGDTSIADRVRFDNHYIEYWSLWLDLVILAKTLPILLTALLRQHKKESRE